MTEQAKHRSEGTTLFEVLKVLDSLCYILNTILQQTPLLLCVFLHPTELKMSFKYPPEKKNTFILF